MKLFTQLTIAISLSHLLSVPHSININKEQNVTELNTSSPSKPPISNNLVIEEGKVLEIPPRLYKYDTIFIKGNATLKVNDNGSKWLVLNAKIIICDGIIQYGNFKRGQGSVTYNLEDGSKLEHAFAEGLGGTGGAGSANGRQPGGLGYRTNDYNGGGGGSGAYYYGTPRQNVAGNAATDFRGAPSPGSSNNCFGGNGARQPYGHGGLICMIADKIIFGAKSAIILRGKDGENGTNGGEGACYDGGAVYHWGGGGGGGGSAGGNGGVLVVKSGNIINQPIVDVSPGKGGRGGAGGKGGSCNFNGQKGTDGDAGELGLADWM